MEQTVYLQLEDGTCLTGKHFGAPLKEDVIAEVVFTTAMTGYTETLTDPSYYGQMVVQTFPLIGNYGVNPKDFESKGIHMSAYITREWCPCPSNFRCQMDLDAFLKQQIVRQKILLVLLVGKPSGCGKICAAIFNNFWKGLLYYVFV